MEEYLSSVKLCLLESGVEPEEVDKVVNLLSLIGMDYDITKKETALVPYEQTDNQQLIKQFIASKLVEGKSKKTCSQYHRITQHFVSFINKSLVDATANDIRAFIAVKMQSGCKSTTLQNIRNYLSSFYKWAVEEGFVNRSPCAKVRPIKEHKEIKKPFTQVEIDALRGACKNEKERALVEFLLSTGARINEVAMMKVSDVDFIKLTVHIREGKGNKERIAYINELTAEWLMRYIRNRKRESDILFDNVKCHSYMTTNGFRSLLYGIGEKAGVANVHPHRFRHTLATILVKRGMAVEKVQQILGHGNVETTMRYIHMDNSETEYSYRMCA